MAFHIRNSETEQLARALARQAKVGITEAVHMALEGEIERRKPKESFMERTAAIRKSVTDRVVNPEPLPRSFYDELYE